VPAVEPEAIGSYLERVERADVDPADPPLPDYIKRTATSLHAALSDIAHERQTHAQMVVWEKTARRLNPNLSRAIEGKGMHEAIQWAAPLEVLDLALPNVDVGDWRFVTVDDEALFATVFCWLLNPELKFYGLHECGRGESCDRERFYFRNRKFCCTEHMKQLNKATNSERSKKRRVIERAAGLLKSRFPSTAKKHVRSVYEPGLSAERLAELGAKAATAARKHK
jgi:hypothetical protein